MTRYRVKMAPTAAAKRLKTHANEGEDCYKSEVEARRKANTLTPRDIHFLRMEEAMDKNNSVGNQLIVGIEGIESDGDCESEEDSDPEGETELTAEQVASLRHILINASRQAALRKAQKFASGSRTSDGNRIVIGIPKVWLSLVECCANPSFTDKH